MFLTISMIFAQNISTSCYDSDRSKNYFTRGTAIVGNNRYNDYCLDKNILNEVYCYDNDYLYEEYVCFYGCKNGVCMGPMRADLENCNANSYRNMSCVDNIYLNYCGIEKINGGITYSWKSISCIGASCSINKCLKYESASIVKKKIGSISYLKTFSFDGETELIEYNYTTNLSNFNIRVWIVVRNLDWCLGTLKNAISGSVSTPRNLTSKDRYSGSGSFKDFEENKIFESASLYYWLSNNQCILILNDTTKELTKEYLRLYPSTIGDLYNPDIKPIVNLSDKGKINNSINLTANFTINTYNISSNLSSNLSNNTIIVINCTNMCLYMNQCHALGTRIENKYCSENFSFKVQLNSGAQCAKGFECGTNSCVKGICEKPSYLALILLVIGSVLVFVLIVVILIYSNASRREGTSNFVSSRDAIKK